MKKLVWTSFGLVSLSTTLAFAEAKSPLPADLNTDSKQVSYTIGHQIGSQLRDQGISGLVDLEQVKLAMQEAIKGDKARLTREQMGIAMNKAQAESQKYMNKVADENQKKGDNFLAQNKKSAGVVVTKSGLQYKVLTEGKGATPTDKSKVKVHYMGTLIDGTEFDSSYKRNEPAEFPVTGVIPGWTEALKLMKPGAKWELAIPSDLAYGKQGRPGIPPNSTLKFTVELLQILPSA